MSHDSFLTLDRKISPLRLRIVRRGHPGFINACSWTSSWPLNVKTTAGSHKLVRLGFGREDRPDVVTLPDGQVVVQLAAQSLTFGYGCCTHKLEDQRHILQRYVATAWESIHQVRPYLYVIPDGL